jgi:hypothetical protein
MIENPYTVMLMPPLSEGGVGKQLRSVSDATVTRQSPAVVLDAPFLKSTRPPMRKKFQPPHLKRG